MNVWPWNVYQMSISARRHEIRKKFDITWLVCKLQNEIPKNPIFRNATSRYAIFTKFCRIINIDVLKTSDQYLKEQSVKCRQMLVCEIRPLKCEVDHLTSTNLLGDVISPISRHWPSFKSFWVIELKTALHEGQTRGQILRKSGLHCIN